MKNRHNLKQKISKRTLERPERRKLLAVACSVGPILALAGKVSPRQLTEALSLTTEDRIALALMRFKMGFHCSQSVFEAYAEDFGIDPRLARRIAAALAGGSTVGGECGAVGSGYLVLGLRHARTVPAHGDVEKEDELFDRVKCFVDEFKKRHGSINCRELLGVDVFTEEGRAEGLRENLFATRCPNFIRDAITILDELG